MTEYEKKIFLKYGNRIHIPKRDILEVIDFLFNNYDILEINPDYYKNNSFNKYYKNFILNFYNIYSIRSNFSFFCYNVILNNKSEKYYNIKDPFPSPIYVFIELKTNTIDSNIAKLKDDLIIYQGLNQSDITKKTDELIRYLLALEHKN